MPRTIFDGHVREGIQDLERFEGNGGHVSRRKYNLEKAYRRVPVWAQNLGLFLYGIFYRRERLGGVFNSNVACFRTRDCWPKERMQEFLQQQLRSVLLHAFREVPYYVQRWSSAGLDSNDLERLTVSELSRLPVIPKRDLVGNTNFFVAQNIAGKKSYIIITAAAAPGHPSHASSPQKIINDSSLLGR